MTKGALGRLAKLKCTLVRWRAKSLRHRVADDDGARQRRPPHQDVAGEEQREAEEEAHEDGKDVVMGGGHGHRSPAQDTDQNVPAGMHPVYVGKSRRRYLIGSHLAGHPAFRVLVQKSGGAEKDDVRGGGSTVVVGCEVVLFEHLLWMLDNADPRHDALDELVDFYSC